MSRLLIGSHLIGALAALVSPLCVAEKVQLETHQQEGSLSVKATRTQLSQQAPTIAFAARAKLTASGAIEYDCIEKEVPADARQGKPFVHEEH